MGRSVQGAGERPFPADETEAVTDTLATTLLALGDLDMDDVQAVRLGHTAPARRLRAAAQAPDGLSTDSVRHLESMTEWVARPCGGTGAGLGGAGRSWTCCRAPRRWVTRRHGA